MVYECGVTNPDNPNVIDSKRPPQAVNFVNAGFTIIW
jgi:hypothetical protein